MAEGEAGILQHDRLEALADEDLVGELADERPQREPGRRQHSRPVELAGEGTHDVDLALGFR